MTCLEAQSNIMAFIEKKLPDDQISNFVRHMKNCPNCSEELEIYYTLIVGMRQLDNNEELSHNFKKELDDELNRLNNRVRNVKRFKLSTFGIIFVACIVLMFFFYNACLTKVGNIEQRRMKEAQGPHYFYDYFSGYIDLCKQDIIQESAAKTQKIERSFYEKIRIYHATHIFDGEKTDLDLDSDYGPNGGKWNE